MRAGLGRVEITQDSIVPESDLPDDLRTETGAAWRRYLDRTAHLRPALHRFCVRLTGDLFDGEDLLQDALLRGFATLGSVHQSVRDPRAYLARIATNVWIDTVRRRGNERRVLEANPEEVSPRKPTPTPDTRALVGDAAKRMLGGLSPQERAAVLLKDAYDMSLKDISRILGTTVGGAKAALHGGRQRLKGERGPSRGPGPSRDLVERFVDRMNAGDLSGLLELMLDSATIHTLGGLLEVGRDEFEREGSWLWQSVHVHPDLPADVRPERWQNEVARFEGEPVMLSFAGSGDTRTLQSLTRLDELEGKVARIRAYYLCPQTMLEVGRRLGIPVGFIPHRVPTRSEWRALSKEGKE